MGAWNTAGERVEGYSSPLWVLWLAAAPALSVGIPTLAKATGAAAHVALVWLLLLPALRGGGAPEGTGGPAGRAVFAGAAVLVALYLPAAWYATSGMETLPFAALVAATLVAPLVAGPAAAAASAAALVWMRPEGALFAGAAGALHLLRARVLGAPTRPALALLLGAACAGALLLGFRLFLFGDWLPNTYYAKASGAGALHLRLGRAYLDDWLWVHTAWVLAGTVALALCALCLARGRRAEAASLAALLALALVFGAYVLRVGGDNPSAFPYWRHFLHLLPVSALLVAAACAGLFPRRPAVALLAVALAAGVADARALSWSGGRLARETRASLRAFPSLRDEPRDPYLAWLARLVAPDTVVASAAAGEMPFVVDAVHLDMLGLNDRHIARSGRFDPRGPVDSKSDVVYVLARRPDVIQLPVSISKILDPGPGKRQRLRRDRMTRAVLGDAGFRRDYLLVTNAPYSHEARALFVRRDWVATREESTALELLPFDQTPLYRAWAAEGAVSTPRPRRPGKR